MLFFSRALRVDYDIWEIANFRFISNMIAVSFLVLNLQINLHTRFSIDWYTGTLYAKDPRRSYATVECDREANPVSAVIRVLARDSHGWDTWISMWMIKKTTSQ